MIKSIHIENFKSFANFELSELGRFTCIIGLNGSGKTTLLQALDFIGCLANGVSSFRGWGKTEIATIGQNVRTCTFAVTFANDDKSACDLQWKGKYNIQLERFTEESVTRDNDPILQLKDGKLTMIGSTDKILPFNVGSLNYQGSILNILNTQMPDIDYVRDQLRQLRSIDLLSPESLRKASQGDTELGMGGVGMPGFLNSLSEQDARELLQELKLFYPTLNDYSIKRRRFGWKRLLVRESALGKVALPAHQVNDGFLRVLAMLSQRYSRNEFLLFDEVENGINQEILGLLVEKLQSFPGKQVVITTHSALLVNYLADETARKSLIFLYKDKLGHTHGMRFFDIEGIADRLEVLGPGEVMGSVNLTELAEKMSSRA